MGTMGNAGFISSTVGQRPPECWAAVVGAPLLLSNGELL